MYYRGALAALLVYDVTNVESFEEVKGWAEELRSNVETSLIVVVVGNKVPAPFFSAFSFSLVAD
jgi:GTPase SAR1 family protein